MFCKNCGTQLEEGKNFCPNCGAVLESDPTAPVVETVETETISPAPVFQEPEGCADAPAGQEPETCADAPACQEPDPCVAEQKEAPDEGSVMAKGIVASALSWIGIPGIILGCIAMNRVKKYRREGYRYSGKLKAGYITGLIGLILGIFYTVVWAVYIIGFYFFSLAALSMGL